MATETCTTTTSAIHNDDTTTNTTTSAMTATAPPSPPRTPTTPTRRTTTMSRRIPSVSPTHSFLIGRRRGGRGKYSHHHQHYNNVEQKATSSSSCSFGISSGFCGSVVSVGSSSGMMDDGGFAEIDCENNNHSNNDNVAFNDNDQVMNTKETAAATPSTTTTSILATMIEAVVRDCAATLPDQVMADTCNSTSEERRQDHENNISPYPAPEQRKSIIFFGSASHGGTVNTPTLTIPPWPPTTTAEQQLFLEMEPSQDDIISISDDNNSIVMDDTEDLFEEDTVLMPEATTRRPCTTASAPPLMPISRCSSPLRKSSLISPTRSSSTRSVVRTIALANEDVVVLEEPTDIRRVSFANNEAIYFKSDLPYLTDEDIARYFWGDRECLESRMQRRALVNAFKRHMRGHRPMLEWTEEIDSVRGLEDHLEDLIGRPSSHCLRRRHEREILTEYYRMKSEGKICSERLGAFSRQSSYEECQRAARAAAEDAIVVVNDQNTYSILHRTETTTGTSVHKRSRSPTSTTPAGKAAVSFMDSLQDMVACGVGYE